MLFSLLSFLPAHLSFLGDITDTFGEVGFVIKLMTLVYILYWLYMTFYQVPLLFGISSMVAGYFLLVNSITVVTLVILFFVFVVMGNMLQMIIQFSVLPLLGVHFTGREFQKIPSTANMAQMEESIMAGRATQAEITEYQLMQQQMGQQQMGQRRQGGF